MPREWVNWSGSIRFIPRRIAKPRDEEELAQIVRDAADARRIVRVVGAGHSSSSLVETTDILVSLTHLRGVESVDPSRNEATIGSGMTLEETGDALFEHRLALHNLGDINVQTAVGAVSTGTHGSGRRLLNIPTALVGGRFVSATGEILDIPAGDIQAFRCALGALGIFTALRLKLLPAFELHRREICTTTDRALEHLDRVADENRNCDFYWYPRSDEVKIRIMDEPGKGSTDVSFGKIVEDRTGWSHAIISKERELRFEEMEYAVPAAAGITCFQEVRRRVLERHRKEVAWRVLYRFIAPDDAWLSTAHGRETVTISLHHNAGLPFKHFFDDIEPIFRAHGGRPHWGKKHNLAAGELRPLYPRWDDFLAKRRSLDPDGVFLNGYLRQLLGEE